MTWEISEQQASRATFTCTLNPQAGWPFTLDLRIDYELGPAGLSVRTSATNAGPRPCPYGAGAHPYLRLGPDTIDGLRLRSPGAVRMLLAPGIRPAANRSTGPATTSGPERSSARPCSIPAT